MTHDADHPADGGSLSAGRGYGATLSAPTEADIERARITDYARWLETHRGVAPGGGSPGRGSPGRGYAGLWQWSVIDRKSVV